MGDFLFEADLRPDYYSGGESSQFEGPPAPEVSAPSSFVMNGTLATQASAPVSGIVTEGNFAQQPVNSVPGVVTNTRTGADAGLGFADLVSNIGVISKQGLALSNQFAPKQTSQLQGVLNKVPGLQSYNNTPAEAKKSGLSAAVMIGAAFAAGLILFKVLKG